MMKWFKNIETLEDLKKAYRKLAREYHPDLNPSGAEIMKEINAEYDKLFEMVKNHHVTADGKTYEKETGETSKEFRDMIDKIITFNIDIEIIGSWIWCFNSYSYREELKALGFHYAAKKAAWTWHTGEYHKRGGKMGIDDIRAKYGSDTIKTKKEDDKLSA